MSIRESIRNAEIQTITLLGYGPISVGGGFTGPQGDQIGLVHRIKRKGATYGVSVTLGANKHITEFLIPAPMVESQETMIPEVRLWDPDLFAESESKVVVRHNRFAFRHNRGLVDI